MWLIKLPFRIIALPIMAIVAVFSNFLLPCIEHLCNGRWPFISGAGHLYCDAFVPTRLDLCCPGFWICSPGVPGSDVC